MIDLQTVNANIARVPFFRFLNFEVQSLDSLHATTEMTFDVRHIGNPIMDYYHGGIIASFMTVDYLRPGQKGPLFARANVTRKGKRIASVSVITWQTETDKPVAEGLYHFLLV